jgi:hypothetical protein
MAADKTKHDLPRAVWALGLTALFMDTPRWKFVTCSPYIEGNQGEDLSAGSSDTFP